MSSIHLSLFCLFAVIYPVHLLDPSCTGNYNTNPIIRDEPTFVSSVPNGKRFVVGTDYTKINIVHVYGGTPYDMGYALGSLMSKELNILIPEYFAYLDKTIEDELKKLPPFVAKWIAELGIPGALDLNYEITRIYTPPWFDEEIRGIAAGSGVSYQNIRRLNLIPELIKAACTVLGAWGESTLTSALLHVRSLDWDDQAPLANYAIVTIYHPNASYEGYADHFHEFYKQENYKSHAFANIGYLGMIGSIGGYSEASIGLGEKVWITKEQDITTRFGNPWTYVLRDVLQFSHSIDSALTMFTNAHRTCSIHLGLGSYERNVSAMNDENIGFRGIEYSANELNIYNWEDMFDTPHHPRLKNVVYWDKHVQPSDDPCLGSLLVKGYGQLSPEIIIQNITSVAETGNAINFVLDYGENAAYVAYSAPDDPQGPLEAYKRAHIRLDMAKLFSEPAPK
ncbi:unnamed protein product [Rotaria socialis]|uniref:Uncharacterized protein n=1 Tax=Rotaria socialis TaxID=392032 RepID=A0A818Y2B6_9BILA|nr:unnamed protein product [Rotaria socialis]CAF3325974.1 unnamed protein product [Rotaria socialis]CAF3749695.1 unnamed protein product [Rotaria socialis]CAF4198892.1 unnamed protein product [Rotaria socialis]CAF4276052.1 unnamed protein product [Rotaria socialis]